MNIIEKQKIEIEFWRDSVQESPESDSIYNIITKMRDSIVFVDCLNRYADRFGIAKKAVELGSGQGWASCIYKRLFPETHITTSDISKFAIQSLPKWEHIWNVKIDNSYACKSYETKESASSVDLIFCFAAAHHFAAHNRTFREIERILKPGGIAFYLYEPACPKWVHSFAYQRVNKKRPSVPEDVLISSKIIELAQRNNLNVKLDYYPSLLQRGVIETIYYYVLNRVPFFQRVLPCTTNFIFVKKDA